MKTLLYIGNKMRVKIYSKNPATNELVGEVDIRKIEDIKSIVERSKIAQNTGRN